MKTYAVFDTGTTTDPRVITCDIRALPPGTLAVEWLPVNGDLNATHYRLQDGALIYDPPAPPVPPEPTYKQLRERAYLQELPYGELADALLKLVNNIKWYALNGVTPDAAARVDTPEGALGRALAIKDRYPKPEA